MIVDEIMNELRGHAIEVPAVYGDGEKTTEKIISLAEVSAILSMIFEIDKTNGDVIKTTFPDIEEEKVGDGDVIDVYGLSKGRVTFDTDFWEAPYKRKDGGISVGSEVGS